MFTAHELIGFMSPALSAEILEQTLAEEKTPIAPRWRRSPRPNTCALFLWSASRAWNGTRTWSKC